MGIFDFGKYRTFKNEEELYSLEIPSNWKLIEISPDYGHVFSDYERKEGKLAIKIIDSFYQDFAEYFDELINVLEKRNNYKLIEKKKLKTAGYVSIEAEFSAFAFDKGKSVASTVIMLAINDTMRERFVVMSFSILKKDIANIKNIYEHAKTTFRFID